MSDIVLNECRARAARRQKFTQIYEHKLWGVGESLSGPGSGAARASLFKNDFETLVRDLAVVTLLDAGCGDFNWLPTFDLSSISIVGVDIVPELVARNRLQYPSMRFEVLDFVSEPLPCADLVICRDGLVHLPNRDIMDALGNFQRSGAKWLLTNTFIDRANVGDISPGEWRPINLEAPPFSLPAPDRTIDERCLGYDGKYRDKRLALWRCDKIPLRM